MLPPDEVLAPEEIRSLVARGPMALRPEDARHLDAQRAHYLGRAEAIRRTAAMSERGLHASEQREHDAIHALLDEIDRALVVSHRGYLRELNSAPQRAAMAARMSAYQGAG